MIGFLKTALIVGTALSSGAVFAAQDVELWSTSKDGTVLLEREVLKVGQVISDPKLPTIQVDPDIRFQSMDGFGFTLTGGSALVLHQMSDAKRAALLKELFAVDDKNIGISYLRVSIAASDLDEKPFSYVELPDSETDKRLQHFSLAEDQKHLIPLLKEILAINPDIKIMGSPWSAPKWMKTNNDTRGGSLKKDYYSAYAAYFVKYLKAMAAEGIVLDSVTVQNEPLNPGNNPSMYMSASDQADFVKNHLGPAFKTAGLEVKIIIYDHNLDHIDYPLAILKDEEAAKYIDGTAFHHYAGTIDEMSRVHDAFPDKNLYFTEQWIGDIQGQNTLAGTLEWHMKNLIIGAPRNWAKTVLEWNLASDENLDPHTDRGGCHLCIGAVTIDGDDVERRPAYYIVAHASKFVRPGSVRISSNIPPELSNVAYQTTDGAIVVIVMNAADQYRQFIIQIGARKMLGSLGAASAGTFVIRDGIGLALFMMP